MERAEILSLENRLKKELFNLISIPSHRDCDRINQYIKSRLNFIKFEDQPVGKRDLYNIFYINPDKPFMINTHVDTVPPITMKNPFVPYEKDGRIYGRGAVDTKGLIAALIVAIRDFEKNNPDKEIPVSLAFTVDEEQNSAAGSEKLIEVLDGIKSVLVLEPTYGRVCTRQSGSFEFTIHLKVKSAHGSEFESFNNPAKELFYLIEKIEKGMNRKVNILKFQSGWEHYAVPEVAQALLEIKVFQDENIPDIEAKLTGIIDSTDSQIKMSVEDAEEFLVFRKGKLFDNFKEAFIQEMKQPFKEGIMPSWTDAANFHKAGFECLVFGYGSLSDAHTDRESISVKELINNYRVLYRFLSILSQS